MNLLDLILIFLVCGFALFGLVFGFARTLGSLIGTVLAVVAAQRLLPWIIATIPFLGGLGSFGKIVLFLFLFFLLSKVVGLVLWLVGRVLGIFAFIPFAGLVDRILGCIFGAAEGIVFIGTTLYFAFTYLPDDAVRATLEASVVGKFLVAITTSIQAAL